MNKYLISFVVPVYNVEKFIEQCINSLLLIKRSEIIIVDDGSTDNSGKICENYSKKYANIICVKKENSGPSDCRNIGLKKATGKYISFVDSDDYILPKNFNELLNFIEKTNHNIYISNYYTILYPKGSTKKIKVYQESVDYSKFLVNIINSKWTILLTYIWLGVYKRDFLIENELYFNSGYKLGEDVDWLLRVYMKTSNVYLTKSDYYVYRGNRKGSLITEKREDVVVSFIQMIEKWMKCDCPIEIKNYLSDCMYNNLDYIYLYTKKEKEIYYLLDNASFWNYTLDKKNLNILNSIKKRGLNKELKKMYNKHITKKIIKKILIVLNILDK